MSMENSHKHENLKESEVTFGTHDILGKEKIKERMGS